MKSETSSNYACKNERDEKKMLNEKNQITAATKKQIR